MSRKYYIPVWFLPLWIFGGLFGVVFLGVYLLGYWAIGPGLVWFAGIFYWMSRLSHKDRRELHDTMWD